MADVMTARPHTAPGGISVEEFIQRYLLGDRHSSYPVENSDGTITGLITLNQLRDVAPDQRARTLIRDVAIPRDQVPTAEPHEPLTALLERLAPLAGARALVVEAGQVVGIVTASDIARVINVRRIASPNTGR